MLGNLSCFKGLVSSAIAFGVCQGINEMPCFCKRKMLTWWRHACLIIFKMVYKGRKCFFSYQCTWERIKNKTLLSCFTYSSLVFSHGILWVFSWKIRMRLPGVEPGSIAWKAIILTVGLQTLSPESANYNFIKTLSFLLWGYVCRKS